MSELEKKESGGPPHPASRTTGRGRGKGAHANVARQPSGGRPGSSGNRGNSKGKGRDKGRERRGRGRGRGGGDYGASRHSGGTGTGAGTPPSGATQICPVCSVSVLSITMGAHLDGCLLHGRSPDGTSEKRRGKKGIDISHLVTYTPRQRASPNEHTRPVRRTNSKQSRSRAVHSRETFLQSNCRFRVKYGEDYTSVLADPDQLVEWEKILEVHINVNEEPRCPVCLGPPVAARITRCGHFYCWHCILHHLAESLKAYHSCPLCDDYVYAKDLRSVRWKLVQPPQVGQQIGMRLLKRERGTMLPLVADEWASAPPSIRTAPTILLTREGMTTDFSKIIPMTIAEMNASYARQTRQLREVCLVEPDKFIHEALAELDRLSYRQSTLTTPTVEAKVEGVSESESEPSEGVGEAASGTRGAVWGLPQHSRDRTVSEASVASLDSDSAAAGVPSHTVDIDPLPTLFGGSSGSAAWATHHVGPSPPVAAVASGELAGADAVDAVGRTKSLPSPIPQTGSAARRASAAPMGSPLVQSWESSDSWGDSSAAIQGGGAPQQWNTQQCEQGSLGWWGGAASGSPSEAELAAAPDAAAATTLAATAPAFTPGHPVASRNSERNPLTGSSDGVYSFYQAADGQAVFLHSLNMRCLLWQYGSVENCPPGICCPVVEIERDAMTPELRKRHKYLSHLPSSCEFVICELDLTSILSEETARHFAAAIDTRRSSRKKRATHERKQAKHQAKVIEKILQKQDAQFQLLLRHDREAPIADIYQTEPATWDACSFPQAGGSGGGAPITEVAASPNESPIPSHRSFSRAARGIVPSGLDNPPLSLDDHPPLAATARVKSGGNGGGGGSPSSTWGRQAKTQPSSGLPSTRNGSNSSGWMSREEYEAPRPEESFLGSGVHDTFVDPAVVAASTASPKSARSGKKGKKVLLLSTSSVRHRD